MKDTFAQLVDHLMNGGFSLDESLGILEKTMVGRAMERCEGNQTEASKLLKIHRNTLRAKIATYGLGNGAGRKAAQTARKPARKRKSA